MTAVTATTAPPASTVGSAESAQPLSLRIRRYALVASPVIAAALALGGTLADPGAGITGDEMNRIYTDNPDPLQWKSFLFHWSYAFWIAPALLLVTYVRGKGRWIANLAGVVGFTGMTTMPGLLFMDYVDSTIGQLHGPAAINEFHDHIEQMWGVPAMVTPGLLCFVLALPLVLSAFWWISAPTREGRAVLDRIAGFKQYLSIAEGERLDRMTPHERTPELFERYLPYAIALGVENRWADRFRGVLAAASAQQGASQGFTWYSGSSSPWSDADGFVGSVGSSLASSVGSASTAPGSGGGGFSGGGGGGGGGGGW